MADRPVRMPLSYVDQGNAPGCTMQAEGFDDGLHVCRLLRGRSDNLELDVEPRRHEPSGSSEKMPDQRGIHSLPDDPKGIGSSALDLAQEVVEQPVCVRFGQLRAERSHSVDDGIDPTQSVKLP